MKNLFKVTISGMAIGIAFLMLGYVGIYYLSGEVIFKQEIAQLAKIKTLQSQLFITGISGMLIALSMYYIEKTMVPEKRSTYKVVLGTVFLTVSAIFAIMLNEKMNENISDMMIVISAFLVCFYAFFNSIRILWYDIKLNKSEKEEQAQETEKGIL